MIGPRARAVALVSHLAATEGADHDADHAAGILAAGDRAEHALQLAAAARALRQTIAAGHPYAALPQRLDVEDVAFLELTAGLCLRLPDHAETLDEVVEVCLLTRGHEGGHGWAGREDAAGMLLDQVDPVARIARRAAAARAELAGADA